MFKKVFHSRSRMAGLLLLALGLIVGLLASSPGLAQSDKVVIVDDRGKEIVVPQPVHRVVVAGTPLFTEIMIDIGASDLLVGVTDSPDNPSEAANITKVGPSLQPNVEDIIALKPDVVVGAVYGTRDQLEAAGIIVVTPVGFVTQLPDIFKIIRDMGAITGHVVQDELLIGQISEAVVSVESQVAQEPRPRVAFLFASSPDTQPYAIGKGSVEGELLSRAGGENVFGDVAGGNTISVEAILERNPEFIFTDSSQVENITKNPVLATVSAVANHHVIGIHASSLTSTRVAETLQAMANALHPKPAGSSGGS
ncbi:ABC transporter substrate-binding protein [Candidatus Acetothermia bacterium]|nr:ABC transporter substrate-binding protein [Candidatus Acetothermia bacterium]